MPEETGAAGSEREDQINRRLDRLEQKLAWEERWWRGGLIAALVFIGISILVAGLHRHRGQLPVPPWMAYGTAGPYAPPPPWYWGPPGAYGYYGWGPGGRPPTPPSAPPPPNK
jgi:hypothetical protein